MSDWQTKPLAAVCQIKPPKSEARERVAADALVSFAPMEDLEVGRKFLNPSQVKPLASVVSSYTYFADGDVLLAKITPCFENGKLGIASGLSSGMGFGSSEFIVFRPDKRLDKEWLYYYLAREVFRVEGKARMTGAVGHKRVPKEFIETYPIPFPPMPEQLRIVRALDNAFENIAIAKANAEKNLQNARALLNSRLRSIFSQRGRAWTDKPLSDVCEFVNGRAYRKHEMLKTGKYPLLRVGNFFTNKDWYYSDLELDEHKYCDTGDLLYAWSASFGPRIWEGGRVIYHYHIWKVIPDSSIIQKRFLLYLLEWDVDQIKLAHGTGTTMMHVSKGSMENRIVPVPPLEEQANIVVLMDELTGQTQRLESLYRRKLAALDELKESLLHRAFSGALSANGTA